MSSPKILVTHPTQKSLASRNEVEDLSDERTPLIQSNQDLEHGAERDEGEVDLSCCSPSPSILYYRIRIISFTVFILTMIFITTYLVLHDLNTLLENVAQTEIDSLSLIGFSDKGIDTHIIGSVTIDYDNLSNPIPVQKWSLQFISSWILGGWVTITPMEPIKLFMKPDAETDYFEFMNVNSPPLPVSIIHKYCTPIDLITLSSITRKNFGKFYKYFFIEEISQFDIIAEFHANFETRWFTLQNYPVKFYTFVDIERDDLPMVQEFGNFHLNHDSEDEGKLAYTTDILISNKFPIQYSIAPLTMTLYTKSCSGSDFIPLSVFVTNEINIEPLTNVNVSVLGTLGEMSSDIQHCPTNGINQLVRDYLAGQSIELYVGSIIPHPRNSLPLWLTTLLSQIHIPVKVMGNSNFISLEEFDFHNITLGSVSASYGSDGFDFIINSDFLMNIELPEILLQLKFAVPVFRSNLVVSYEEKESFEISSKQDSYLNLTRLENDSIVANFSLNSLGIKLNDGVANLINDVMSSSVEIPISIDIDDLNVEVDIVPFLSTIFESLSIKGLDYNIKSGSFDIPNIISSFLLEISISNIRVLSSGYEKLDLALDIDVEINGDILLDFQFAQIKYNIYSNSQIITSFKIKDIDRVTNKMSFPLEITIYQNEENEFELQSLISKFLSGRASDLIQLDILDGDLILLGNSKASKIISELEFHNVSLPNFEFKKDKEVNLNELISVQSSPFLIDATIYILKSEIELTIYNPLTNCNILVEIVSADATYEDSELGYVGRQHMDVPPGIFVLQRIPFTMNKEVGSDILRKALNNQLDIQIKAIFDVKLKGQLFESLQLMYRGAGLKTNIKL